jgi:hypothetical protein
MPDPDEQQAQEAFHLPAPSYTPIVLSFGIAMMLFGLVPDSRLWRFALISIGGIIALIAGMLWYRAAREDYEHLH